METLQLRLGGLSILFRSRDLPIRDWVAPYEPFLADGGDGHDILADLELVLRGSGRRVAAAEQERLLAHVREYLEQAVRPSPVQERVIQLRLKAVSDLLSSPAFVECLQDFDPVGGQWRSLKVGGPHVWFVDGDVRRGRFFFSAEGFAGDQGSAIDGCLYELVRLSLARQRGMILHAAGVVHEGRSHVFVGPSGAGKTTIARASWHRGWGVLADDGLIVRQMPDGGFRAFRTPWRMSVPTWRGRRKEQPDSAELSTLFFIEHGTRERWTKLTPLEAVAMMAGNSMGPLRQCDGAGHADTIFGLLGQLGSQVPSYHLCFTPACEFLAAIDELEGIRKEGKNDEE